MMAEGDGGQADGLTFLSSSLLLSRSGFLSLELRLPEFLGAALGP